MKKKDDYWFLPDSKMLEEMEEERKHIEDIFYARFNYFILFFTLFLSIEAAIFLGDSIPAAHKLAILTALSFFGLVVSLFIYITLCRVRKALEVTLSYRDFNSTTAQLIRKKLGEREKGTNRYLTSANYILSSTIPLLCTLFMAVLFFALISCYLKGEPYSFFRTEPADTPPCPCSQTPPQQREEEHATSLPLLSHPEKEGMRQASDKKDTINCKSGIFESIH